MCRVIKDSLGIVDRTGNGTWVISQFKLLISFLKFYQIKCDSKFTYFEAFAGLYFDFLFEIFWLVNHALMHHFMHVTVDNLRFVLSLPTFCFFLHSMFLFFLRFLVNPIVLYKKNVHFLLVRFHVAGP